MPTSALGGAIDLDPDLVALKPSFSFIVELVHSNFLQGEDATILDQMPISHRTLRIVSRVDTGKASISDRYMYVAAGTSSQMSRREI